MENKPFEHQEGKGSLLVNTYKKDERHPDFKGSIKINGHTYAIAAWSKQTKSGMDMFSITVDQKWSNAGATALLNSAFPVDATPATLNDDVPF